MSPIAYVLGASFLLVNGYIFWIILEILNSASAPPSSAVIRIFFGGIIFFWINKLFLAPCLTMKSFAEEKKNGTIESLLTAPVTDFQIVIAKFLSSLLMYIILWSSTLIYLIVIDNIVHLDIGSLISGFFGTFLIGGYFISIGIFTSCMTKNQIIAAVTSFSIILLFFSVGLFEFIMSNTFFGYINLWKHMQNFSKGIIDTKAVFYCLSSTVFFLFGSIKILESRNWR